VLSFLLNLTDFLSTFNASITNFNHHPSTTPLYRPCSNLLDSMQEIECSDNESSLHRLKLSSTHSNTGDISLAIHHSSRWLADLAAYCLFNRRTSTGF
jgi:hypothetical protein